MKHLRSIKLHFKGSLSISNITVGKKTEKNHHAKLETKLYKAQEITMIAVALYVTYSLSNCCKGYTEQRENRFNKIYSVLNDLRLLKVSS